VYKEPWDCCSCRWALWRIVAARGDVLACVFRSLQRRQKRVGCGDYHGVASWRSRKLWQRQRSSRASGQCCLASSRKECVSWCKLQGSSGTAAIEVGYLGGVETILNLTSSSSQCVTSNEQCNEQCKPACGRGATEPHGLAVRHSSRMVSSITVCCGRLISRMSTATVELRYSLVNVQQRQEIYRNPTTTLEIDLMMSVQPNLWCLDLNPAPRAGRS